jgi:RNA polymerase sigma-70 factor (ECF subfamily)
MINKHIADTDYGFFTSHLATEREWLVRLCGYLSGDSAAAQDLTQETLLEAWRLREKLSDTSGYKPWLAAIARNVCLRWRRNRSLYTSRVVTDPTLLEAIPDNTDFETELEKEELAVLLDRALALLPPDTREILIARYIGESPLAEVARRLGISENGVAVRVHRGKLALRRILLSQMQEDTTELAGTGWQSTSLWCPFCGKTKLSGRLSQTTGEFALRCPSCSPNGEVVYHTNYQLLPLFRGVAGFRAALNRHAKWAANFETQALSTKSAGCYACGSSMRLELVIPPELPQVIQRLPGFHLRCTRCPSLAWSSLTVYALYLPQARRFWEQHRRIRLLPQQEIEADGQKVIRITFASLNSTATFDTLIAGDSYQIIKTNGE